MNVVRDIKLLKFHHTATMSVHNHVECRHLNATKYI